MLSLIIKTLIVGCVVAFIVHFITFVAAYAIPIGAVAALIVFLTGVGL